MAIREEYQQLEAKIKKAKERSRKLDSVSLGIDCLDDQFAVSAYYYDETGQTMDDVIDIIISDFVEILEQENEFLEKSFIEDLLKLDEYKNLESPLDTIVYEDLPIHLDFIIKVINHILAKHDITENSQKEIGCKERIDRTLTMCKCILDLYNNPEVNIDTISIDLGRKYLIALFPKIIEILHEGFKGIFLTMKKDEGLTDNEFEIYCEALSKKTPFLYIFSCLYRLVLYLLFVDDEPRYVEQVFKIVTITSSGNTPISYSSHTIDDIFNLLKTIPSAIAKNLFVYCKGAGYIDTNQFSLIIKALETDNLDLFGSSISQELVSIFDIQYEVIEFSYAVFLLCDSETKQEDEMSKAYFTSILNKSSMRKSSIVTVNRIIENYEKYGLPLLLIEVFIEKSPILLGFICYFYRTYKHHLFAEDQKYFDQIITQEPYKDYCDKALLELDKQYPNNKTPLEFWNLISFVSENNNQNQTERSICDIPAEEVATIESESKPKSNSEMIVNPFGGLESEALKQCNSDKRSYVGMFIDYLIYRGYIDAENKDAYVCCLCDEMISEDTLEHLKYNITNKEGIRNSNIVTLMLGRLTRFTANNQIEVNGRKISGGGIYFNNGQIDNGELEEWCLFWPFLRGQNIEGFKKLFQTSIRSQDLKMENALKRVTSFIEDYETTKQQNPGITKLDFIKMRHECH